MNPLQQTKFVLVEHLALASDALHIYLAVFVFLGSCLLFKWKARQWQPWLAALAVALIGELWELRNSLSYDAPARLAANWKDVWNAMLIPTVLMLAARYSKLFGKG